MCGKNYFYLCILFAIATILQICFHASFAVYSYYMNICANAPTNAPTVFFYLTYLYRDVCGSITLDKSGKLPPIFDAVFDSVSYSNLSEIMEEILKKADFPEHATAQPRTWRYLLGFIIIDSVWLVASVALLMGACFRIKEFFTVIYYGPWLVTTACALLVDVAATVHFSFDIFKTTTFTDWMNFVGIKNVQELQDIDMKNKDFLLPLAPTIVMLTFLTKFIVFWIINIFGLYYVMQATNFSWNQSYKTEYKQNHRHPRNTTNNDLELDTSEARIRNWQLFYGATETSRSSIDSNDNKDVMNSNKQSLKFEGEEVESHNNNSTNNINASTSVSYFAYPHVDSVDLGCMEELRGQKPWSYFPGHENSALYIIKQQSEDEVSVTEHIELKESSIVLDRNM